MLERAHVDVTRLCAEMQGVEPRAPRVKTLKTTLEKLHRHAELHSLAQIRDLAGLRVVVHGTRADQDRMAPRIAELFGNGDRLGRGPRYGEPVRIRRRPKSWSGACRDLDRDQLRRRGLPLTPSRNPAGSSTEVADDQARSSVCFHYLEQMA